MTLKLSVNGKLREVRSDPDTPLLFVLRNELRLKGAKLGCGLEQCGACAVLVDGESVLSCATAVEAFVGKQIVTVEALAETETGQRVQQAFMDASAAQCGYCTSGLVVAVTGLLDKTPRPDEKAVAEALTGHLCRCGSHPRILRAIENAAEVG